MIPPAEIAAQLAELWGDTTPAASMVPAGLQPVPPPKLPPLPTKMVCPLDHRLPENWEYGPDRYGRNGARRVSCRACGKFYGYTAPANKQSTQLLATNG